MTKVTVVAVDAYGDLGVLVPFLAKRLAESIEQLGDESGMVIAQFMARLWGRDPNVLLVAAVDPKGIVKGYTAAQIDVPGSASVLTPRLDEPTENDAVKQMMDLVEKWAKSRQAVQLQMISKRADPKWLKKYGFETTRYVMTKNL